MTRITIAADCSVAHTVHPAGIVSTIAGVKEPLILTQFFNLVTVWNTARYPKRSVNSLSYRHAHRSVANRMAKKDHLSLRRFG